MTTRYAATEIWDPNAQPGGLGPDSLKEAYASSGIGNVMEKFGSPGNAFRIDPLMAQHKPFDTITEMFAGQNEVLTKIVRGRYESADTWHFEVCPRRRSNGLQTKTILSYNIPSVMPNRRTPLTQPDRFSTTKSSREVIMTQFALGVDFEGDSLRTSGEGADQDFDMKMAVMASSAVLQGKYHVHVAFLTSKIEHRQAISALGQPASGAFQRAREDDKMLGILHREKGIFLLLSYVKKVMAVQQKSFSMMIAPSGALELMAYGNSFDTEYWRRGPKSNEVLESGGDAFINIGGVRVYEEESKIFAMSQGPIEHDPMLNKYTRGLYWLSTNEAVLRQAEDNVTAARAIWFVDFDSDNGALREIPLIEQIGNAICFDQNAPHLPLRTASYRSLAASPDSAIADIGNVPNNSDGDPLIDPFIYFPRTTGGGRSTAGRVCHFWGQQDTAYANEDFYARIAMVAENVISKDLTSYGSNGGAAIMRLLDILNSAYETTIDVAFARQMGGDATGPFGVPPMPANSAYWRGAVLPPGMSTYAHAAYLANVYENGSAPAETSPEFRSLLKDIYDGVRAVRKLLSSVRRVFGQTANAPAGASFENLFLRAATQLPSWTVAGPLGAEYAFFMNCIDTVKLELRTSAADADGNNARREDGAGTEADALALSAAYNGVINEARARIIVNNKASYPSIADPRTAENAILNINATLRATDGLVEFLNGLSDVGYLTAVNYLATGQGEDVDIDDLQGIIDAGPPRPAVIGRVAAQGPLESLNTGLSVWPAAYTEEMRRAGINPASPVDDDATIGALGVPGARAAQEQFARGPNRRHAARHASGVAYADAAETSAMWNPAVAAVGQESRAFVRRLVSAQKYARSSPLLRAMLMLYIGQPIYGASLKNMADWGVPVPLNFIVVAPFVEFYMQSAYFCSPNVGVSEFDFEDAYVHTRADIKLVSVESMWFATCYIIDSRDIYISPGVKFAGYQPGTCTKTWMTSFRVSNGQRSKALDFEVNRFGERTGALISLYMGGSQDESDIGHSASSVFDLAGKFATNDARNTRIDARGNRQSGDVTYPSALFVNRETGIYRLNTHKAVNDTTMLDIQRSKVIRTTVSRAVQYAWNSLTGEPTRRISSGCGLFADIAPGCRNLLEGGVGLINGGLQKTSAV